MEREFLWSNLTVLFSLHPRSCWHQSIFNMPLPRIRMLGRLFTNLCKCETVNRCSGGILVCVPPVTLHVVEWLSHSSIPDRVRTQDFNWGKIFVVETVNIDLSPASKSFLYEFIYLFISVSVPRPSGRPFAGSPVHHRDSMWIWA